MEGFLSGSRTQRQDMTGQEESSMTGYIQAKRRRFT
jgi:hypothetical protein